MSLIQPLLKRRHRHRRAAILDGTARGADVDPAGDDLRTSSLGCQATWYRESLGSCNESLLQYEWAWLNGRIEALEHFRHEARESLAEMLAESQLFRTLMLREFAARGLRPSPPKDTVVPSEEAWAITALRVKEEWGIL